MLYVAENTEPPKIVLINLHNFFRRIRILNNNLYLFSALAALAGHHQQGRPQTTQQTHEMTVPNELIGCIIGKGGSKIAEIR